MYKRRILHLLLTVAISISVLAFSKIDAYAAPKQMPDGVMFDPEYYAVSNPDVVAALGNSESALYGHYKKYGKKEGRKPYADGTSGNQAATPAQAPASTVKKMSDGGYFDAAYYAQNNPDVVAAVGNSESALYKHYKKYGQKEGRKAFAPGSVPSPIKITAIRIIRPRGVYMSATPDVEFKNTSGKTINYIYFTLTPYNAVGDKVTKNALGVKIPNPTYRCTGPLENGQTADFGMPYAWYDNGTITTFTVDTIKITYADGSVEEVSPSIAIQ